MWGRVKRPGPFRHKRHYPREALGIGYEDFPPRPRVNPEEVPKETDPDKESRSVIRWLWAVSVAAIILLLWSQHGVPILFHLDP